ncbi:FUSC family protein [Carnobacterium sp. CS13]|uniref:FUSC family protein n=1 Tax=Carnobacterium sp. CS13 TaxID=2800128 RepID=UPI0019128E91|nr:aromatic acid exporter family protein [Carnobacterium sp. CS13]QQP69676.1 FUSC family protein [Carnobacterium sp. CS13]
MSTIGNYRLGMRTIKTALAVAICILVFHFFDRGAPMIACLSAIYALRENWKTSYAFGKTRILGNSIGALTATAFVLIQHFLGETFWFELIGVPLAVIFIIVLCDRIGNNPGIIGATAAFLIIYYTIPLDNAVLYAVQRLFDAFIGTFIAIGVNRLVPAFPKKSAKK